MHVLLQVALDILQHTLGDVQALHVDHDLPDRLVLVHHLDIFILVCLSCVRLFSSQVLAHFTSGRMKALLIIVALALVHIVTHDSIMDFGDGFQNNAAELTLPLATRIFATN